MPGSLLDRFLARLIDAVILGVVFGALITSLVSSLIIGGVMGYGRSPLFVYGLIVAVLGLALNLGYYVLLETRNGQTVGKMVMKLRVHGPDGGPPSVEQSLRRNSFLAIGVIATVIGDILGIVPGIGGALGGLASFLIGIAGLGLVIYIAYTINEDEAGRQGWHDGFAGGTRVTKEAPDPAMPH